MESDPKRYVREWNREIEAEILRRRARHMPGGDTTRREGEPRSVAPVVG